MAGVQLGIINSVTEQWEERADCPHTDTLRLGFELAKQNGAAVVDLDLQQKESRWGDEVYFNKRLMDYSLQAKNFADELGLIIRSLPICLLGSADWNKRVRRFYKNQCKHYMDCACAAGATRLLAVFGEGYWNREVIDRLGLRGIAVEVAQFLGEEAKRRSTAIDVELEPFAEAICGNALTLSAFLKNVAMPNVVVANIDVQHFILTDAWPDDLDQFAGAAHCHPNDCNLAVHVDKPPGEGKIPEEDWIAWMQKMHSNGINHWMLELEFADHEQDIPEYIRRGFDGAKRLAQQAGIVFAA